jgi:hypothetical protein
MHTPKEVTSGQHSAAVSLLLLLMYPKATKAQSGNNQVWASTIMCHAIRPMEGGGMLTSMDGLSSPAAGLM